MRYHRGSDGWGRDSYVIPQYAVVGSSDCGESAGYYNPAPSGAVEAELNRFRAHLREHQIKSRFQFTQSGNVCMLKRWVVVRSQDFERAADLARAWLEEHQADTRYVHDADLPALVAV
jgi:hypothetical protein